MGCRSILIVDDNIDIRETLQMVLDLEGYSVHTAANGKNAFEVLPQCEGPALILLDLMMPVMNGFTFLEQIKQRPEYASFPVIVISAFEDEARKLTVEGFLPKPIEIKDLRKVCSQYCSEALPS